MNAELRSARVANHERADYRIDRPVIQRQAQRVGTGQKAAGAPHPAAAGQQHRVREVDSQGNNVLCSPPPGQVHQVAGTGPDV